jgi:hypothetical protein
MIRTVRKVMTGLLDFTCNLSDEMLSTVFCEVEAIVNGRPLTKVSDDINDLAPLTPNHLLLLRECPSLPPGMFHQSDVYKKRWRCVQFIAEQFWRRWLHEYVPELQRRQKWFHKCRNFQIGDLVMIVGENTPRGIWPLAIVVDVIPGRDGLVRSVKLKTKSTQLIRPVTKIVLLEGV